MIRDLIIIFIGIAFGFLIGGLLGSVKARTTWEEIEKQRNKKVL